MSSVRPLCPSVNNFFFGEAGGGTAHPTMQQAALLQPPASHRFARLGHVRRTANSAATHAWNCRLSVTAVALRSMSAHLLTSSLSPYRCRFRYPQDGHRRRQKPRCRCGTFQPNPVTESRKYTRHMSCLLFLAPDSFADMDSPKQVTNEVSNRSTPYVPYHQTFIPRPGLAHNLVRHVHVCSVLYTDPLPLLVPW